jgi:hypothetical protein
LCNLLPTVLTTLAERFVKITTCSNKNFVKIQGTHVPTKYQFSLQSSFSHNLQETTTLSKEVNPEDISRVSDPDRIRIRLGHDPNPDVDPSRPDYPSKCGKIWKFYFCREVMIAELFCWAGGFSWRPMSFVSVSKDGFGRRTLFYCAFFSNVYIFFVWIRIDPFSNSLDPDGIRIQQQPGSGKEQGSARYLDPDWI